MNPEASANLWTGKSSASDLRVKRDTSPFFDVALDFYVLNRYDEVSRLPQHSSAHEFEDFYLGVVELLQQSAWQVKDANTIRQLLHTFYRVAES